MSGIDPSDSVVTAPLMWLYLSVAAVILSAFAGVMQYKASEKAQGLQNRKYEARIKESELEAAKATDSAAKANAEAALATDSAAIANERTQKLENANLTLRANLTTLETELTEARTKQVQAQKTADLAVKRTFSVFLLNRDAFLRILAGQPKLRVEIMFKPEDEVAYFVADQLGGLLKEAGWEILCNRALTETDAIAPKDSIGTPLVMRAGGTSTNGITMIGNKPPMAVKPPFRRSFDALNLALLMALNTGTKAMPMDAGGTFAPDPKMPDDVVRFIVAPRIDFATPDR
jgi:hypothetical protein